MSDRVIIFALVSIVAIVAIVSITTYYRDRIKVSVKEDEIAFDTENNDTKK